MATSNSFEATFNCRFLGAHAMIIGGYGQFTSGLASTPTPLDIRFNHAVRRINYSRNEGRTTPDLEDMPITITCNNGDTVHADAVVVTVSLGVLKSGAIEFEPELPDRKRDAISRLGFGLLNKVFVIHLIANLRLFLFTTNRSGIQMQTLLDACELQVKEIHYVMIHMSVIEDDSILFGIALHPADDLHSVEVAVD